MVVNWHLCLCHYSPITQDNRDAEAFLKPVSKAEVPDYLEGNKVIALQAGGANPTIVIVNPMDLSTMLKKVKQKQYKSKWEFNQDLELIWKNCYTYNAAKVCSILMCPIFHVGDVST